MSTEHSKNVASLVLGIISVITWITWLFGLPISAVGLFLGLKKKYKTGVILNSIGLGLSFINLVIGITVFRN